MLFSEHSRPKEVPMDFEHHHQEQQTRDKDGHVRNNNMFTAPSSNLVQDKFVSFPVQNLQVLD